MTDTGRNQERGGDYQLKLVWESSDPEFIIDPYSLRSGDILDLRATDKLFWWSRPFSRRFIVQRNPEDDRIVFIPVENPQYDGIRYYPFCWSVLITGQNEGNGEAFRSEIPSDGGVALKDLYHFIVGDALPPEEMHVPVTGVRVLAFSSEGNGG